MPGGTEVTYTGKITEEKDGHVWAEVAYDGKTGWVAVEYLEEVEDSSEKAVSNDEYFTAKDDISEKTTIQQEYTESADAWNPKDFCIQTDDGEVITPSITIKQGMESIFTDYYVGKTTAEISLDENMLEALYSYLVDGIEKTPRPNNIGVGLWYKQKQNDLKWVESVFGKSSKLAKALKTVPYISIALDTGLGIKENVENNAGLQETATDIALEIGFGATEIAVTTLGAKIGTAILPGIGSVAGAIAGAIAGIAFNFITENVEFNDKSIKEWLDETIDWAIDGIKSWFN